MAGKRALAPLAAALLLAGPVTAQGLLHQPTDNDAPQPLPAEIRARLADPFFRIVLASTPQPGTLDAVIAALTEGGAGFQTFAVGEQIGRPEATLSDPEPGCDETPLRRLVISFSGTHAPSGAVLDSNVFISTFLTPNGPGGPMEVMGWDETHGTYNYYKREEGSWRFRNSSSDLATADANTLATGCLACHVNGGPIMKEFSFPWNNWHSSVFDARYLSGTSGTPWPAASTPLLASQRLASAEFLENIVRGSLQRFATRTVADRVAVAADGSVTVSGLPGLLDSLFVPTELNLVSSRVISGLDGGGLTQPTAQAVPIPDAFFADVAKLSDLGLDPPEFTPPARAMQPAEYAGLLEALDVETDCLPGRDTVFAWFGPETSEFDRRMVDRLIRRGVIDRQLAAAVLAVDLEVPLFSERRASLLRHVPDTISAPTAAALPDAVRAAILDSLGAVPAADRTDAEAEFLSLLESGDPVAELDRRVSALHAALQDELDPANPEQRAATLERLYRRLVENREQFLASPVSARQGEFLGLFPEPSGG